jgi:excisionase family DNA binding protein
MKYEMAYLTTHEAADQIRVHPRTIKRYIHDGELPAFALGNRGGYRISQKDLAAFMVRRSDPLAPEYGSWYTREKQVCADCLSEHVVQISRGATIE